MPMPGEITIQPSGVGAGIITTGQYKVTIPFSNIENGLNIGRIAKVDFTDPTNPQLQNLDGSATPTLGGVVLAGTDAPVEDDVYSWDPSTYQFAPVPVDTVIKGGVTLKLTTTSGTPQMFGAVYVRNAASDDENGLVETVSSGSNDPVTGAVFLQKMQEGYWEVLFS